MRGLYIAWVLGVGSDAVLESDDDKTTNAKP